MLPSIRSTPYSYHHVITLTGTGVPVCLAGAKVTAEQILDHAKISIPWTSNEKRESMLKEKASVGALDVKKGSVSLSLPTLLIMLFVALFAFLYRRILRL